MTEHRDPVVDDDLGVFVPALMGAGLILSGFLVIVDWVRKLLPNRGVRRSQQISMGAKGVVTGVAEAAGYEIHGPNFVSREWRSRWVYGLGFFACVGLGLGALALGLLAFNNDVGLFYRNPWMVGLGAGSAVVFGLVALQLAFFAVVYRRSFRGAHVLVQTTWFGRPERPPADPLDFATSLQLVPREGMK